MIKECLVRIFRFFCRSRRTAIFEGEHFEYQKDQWVHNSFRWFEKTFGRKYGIRHEASAMRYTDEAGRVITVFQFHSVEAVLTHFEQVIRASIPRIKPGFGGLDIHWGIFGKLGFSPVRVWIPKLSPTGGLPAPQSPFLLAIAYDTSTANAGGTSGSFNYTVTGSLPILFVHTNGDSLATASVQGPISYNSVALTKALSQNTNTAGTQYGQCIFMLVGPATGSNSLAYNSGHATEPIRLMVSSYSGVKQTGQPDASAQDRNTAGTDTGATVSVTVVAANSWVVFGAYNNGGNIAISSGATLRQQPVARTDGWWGDTNGPVSAGANAATWTWNSSGNWGVQGLSFSPFEGSSSPSASVSPSSSVSPSVSPSSSVSPSPSSSPSPSVSPSSSVSPSISSSPSSSISASPSPSSSASASTSPSPSPSPAPDTCVRIVVNDVDRTRLVKQYSLRINQIATNEPDTAEFTINRFGSRTFSPAAGDRVVIKDSGVHVFAGLITQVEEEYDVVDYVSYKVTCTDYTYLLSGKLVAQTYENMTVAAIIQSLKTNGYIPPTFTLNNVDVTDVVEYISFKYEPVSDVLTQIAELVGAEWYVDAYKDIHFNLQGTELAPFNLSDNGGKYIYDSLLVRRDQTQVRNVVYVRGGDYLADTVTAVFDGNAAQRYFTLPYKMSNLGLTVTGATKSVGVDPIDDPNSFDAMHNFQEKTLFFREDRIPRDTSALAAALKVRIRGNPNLPILALERDGPAIASFTAREHFIEDPSIMTREAARQRALAELAAYKSTIAEAEFSTYESTLRVGQTITIQSDLRDLDEDYVITKIRTTQFSEDADGCPKLVYQVSLVTTRTFEFTKLLQRLLNRDKKRVILDGTEITDIITTLEDTFSGVDSSLWTASNYTTYYWGPGTSRPGYWGFATWT